MANPFDGEEILCPYRQDVRRGHGAETATCLLLQRITGAEARACAVDRSACELCSSAFPSPAARLNPVIPSLLYHVCDAAIADGAAEDLRPGLRRLQAWAAQSIDPPSPHRRVTHGCDVIVCCPAASEDAFRAVESALAQRNVAPIVHLIDDGGQASALVRRYEEHPQVMIHRNDIPKGPFATLQELAAELRTPYVAIQDPGSVSRPERLETMIAALEERRGEVAGSAIRIGGAVVDAQRPGGVYRRALPAETLVFRRASFVDMGGFSERPLDADVEFVHRADCEGRVLVVDPLPLVERAAPGIDAPVGPPPAYVAAGESLRRHARGFKMRRVACDVVLPFHGHPDFVDAAVESILHQHDADVVLHLVDDAGEIGDSVFRRWSPHRAVRTYRNSRNIGPFASFNNVAEHFETEWCAVQDADDISVPGRLHWAGNLLSLSGSDIFAGRTETFGSATTICPTNVAGGPRRERPAEQYRWSRYPHPGVRYFIENPTVVMRAAAFRQIGGFADFGERQRSRTGVDTEFYARAYYAGLRFAITRDVVLRYRCHSDSATQNLQSGWGTKARAESYAERNRRIDIFQHGGWFDPRIFGSLTQSRGVTKKLPRGAEKST